MNQNFDLQAYLTNGVEQVQALVNQNDN